MPTQEQLTRIITFLAIILVVVGVVVYAFEVWVVWQAKPWAGVEETGPSLTTPTPEAGRAPSTPTPSPPPPTPSPPVGR